MSSTGQAVGMVAGGVIGSFFGMTALGASIGGAIGGYIDPPKSNTQGPRLSDLTQQVSTYGAPIPRVYGTLALYGCVFWIENNRLKEVESEESAGGKGGGGATVTNFTYYGTFALGLCMGPITGVKRIWIGPKLFYDGSATDASGIAASQEALQHFTLYTGSTTQTADPRMEAALGVGSVPGYRGLAYIVFKDLDLTEYGNSIVGAQIKVEVTTLTVTQSYAVTAKFTVPTGNSYTGMTRIGVTPDPFTWWVGKYSTETMGAYTRLVFGGVIQEEIHHLDYGYSLSFNDGGQYEGFNGVPYSYDDTGLVIPEQVLVHDFGFSGLPASLVPKGIKRPNGTMIFSLPYVYSALPNQQAFHLAIGNTVIATRQGLNSSTSNSCSGTNVHETNLNSSTWTITVINDDLSSGPTYTLTGKYVIGAGYLTHLEGNILYVCYTEQVSLEYQAFLVTINLSALTSSEFQLSVPDGYTGLTDYLPGSGGFGLLAFRVYPYGIVSTWFYHGYDVVQVVWGPVNIYGGGTDTVELSSILSAEALQSNLLSAGDIDVTAITARVRGYKVVEPGTIRSAIEPLQKVWPFDVVPSGYKLKFVPRGGGSAVTIPESDLDARQFGDAPGIRLSESIEMDTQLPRKVLVNYLDASREYDYSQQYAERTGTDAVNEATLEIPVVLTATEAANVAQQMRDLYWLERFEDAFKIPPGATYSKIEPSDVITVQTATATHSLRLTDINYLPDGRMECTARRNLASTYSPSAVGESGTSTGKTIAGRAPSALVMLDIPQMHADQGGPSLLAAMRSMSPIGTTWPGAVLMMSRDSGVNWTQVAVKSSTPSTMGITSTTLAAPARYGIPDVEEVTVEMKSGSPSSVAFASLLDGYNLFAIGVHGRWEIVGVQTVKLVSGSTYIFRDMLRGLYGTEWAASLHSSADNVILLTPSSLSLVTLNDTDLDSTLLFKAVTLGSTIDTALSVSVASTGMNMKTLSPVYANGERDASGNWTVTATRRTRFNGSWANYADVPLNEVVEAYEMDVFDSSYTTLKRTISASTLSFPYSSADQTTDFGSDQSTIYFRIYQISATRGRGTVLQSSLTR